MSAELHGHAIAADTVDMSPSVPPKHSLGCRLSDVRVEANLPSVRRQGVQIFRPSVRPSVGRPQFCGMPRGRAMDWMGEG